MYGFLNPFIWFISRGFEVQPKTAEALLDFLYISGQTQIDRQAGPFSQELIVALTNSSQLMILRFAHFMS